MRSTKAIGCFYDYSLILDNIRANIFTFFFSGRRLYAADILKNSFFIKSREMISFGRPLLNDALYRECKKLIIKITNYLRDTFPLVSGWSGVVLACADPERG